MENEPGVLLVDDRQEDRALMEIMLRDGLPSARLSVATDAVSLGQLLATETFQASVIEATLEWYDASALVRKLREQYPDCLVVFYSEQGVQTLTPEILDLGLTGYYRKNAGDLLQITRVLAQRLDKLAVAATQAVSPVSSADPEAIGTEEAVGAQEAVDTEEAPEPFHRQEEGLSDSTFRTEMLYAISHDLKQPLYMFNSQVKFLDTRYKHNLDAAGKGLLDDMARVVEHMETLLDSIFSDYRLDAATNSEETLANIDEVIESVLIIFRPTLDEISGRVIVGKLPRLQVGKGPMIRLFQNLISNAIKFRGSAPLRIEINTLDVNDYWLFTVQDSGVGMDQDKADQLFTMFKRLHSPEKYPDSGMGLAVCKRIIEQQGGKIWARSKPGEGVAIHFTLPKLPIIRQNAPSRDGTSNNEVSDKNITG